MSATVAAAALIRPGRRRRHTPRAASRLVIVSARLAALEPCARPSNLGRVDMLAEASAKEDVAGQERE
jgi:hypothetical protein